MGKNISKEELILQTAMQQFIEKGRHGAKMQEIADKAGINKALLHYYYRSKEKLYAKIFEFLIWNNVSEVFKLFEEDISFTEFIRKFIYSYTDLLNKNPKIPMFLLRELSEGGNTVKAVLKNLVDSKKFSVEKPLTIINTAMQKGEMVQMDPKQFIATLVGSCLFFFIAEPIFATLFIDESSFNRDAFIEKRKEAIYQTILYGVIPRGEA